MKAVQDMSRKEGEGSPPHPRPLLWLMRRDNEAAGGLRGRGFHLEGPGFYSPFRTPATSGVGLNTRPGPARSTERGLKGLGRHLRQPSRDSFPYSLPAPRQSKWTLAPKSESPMRAGRGGERRAPSRKTQKPNAPFPNIGWGNFPAPRQPRAQLHLHGMRGREKSKPAWPSLLEGGTK